MSVEIVPAINVNSFEEAELRIKFVEPFVDWVQIDIADGTYTKNTIWHNPLEVAEISSNINIELHLMIDEVERRIENWLLPNVKRIIFHLEASKDVDFVIEKIKNAGKEVGIAISPGTSWTKAAQYKDKVNFFQILGVNPGLPGQKTVEETYDKIKNLKNVCKSCIIEVDGGMNKETAKKAVEAGADIIAAASIIFKEDNIEKAIKDLNESLN